MAPCIQGSAEIIVCGKIFQSTQMTESVWRVGLKKITFRLKKKKEMEKKMKRKKKGKKEKEKEKGKGKRKKGK